uniref:MOM1 alpha-helical domain-containing protein n=1 Tax=Zea mays TaxID=4577 RepID=A0A804N413_MAIZE
MGGILFELVGPIHISRDPGTIPRPAASLQRCCASDTRTSHYLGLFTPLKGKHIDEVAKSKQSTVSTKTKKKLQRLPDGCHPDFDNDHLCSVNNHDLLPEMSTPSADLHLLPETGVENMRTPKSLHAELKRELLKLNTVLKLPFLEYLLNNHLVVREPRSILHAFNIALCWRAASFLKYTELDRRESLSLASDGLNYECNEAPS